MKLTERSIASINPGNRDIFAWDGILPGFGVRVKPSGRKSYIVQYRTIGGTSRRLTIGPTSAFRLEQARKRARKLIVEAKDGADPASDRSDARKAPTVSEVCDRYLAEHVRPHNSPSTAREFRRLVESCIKPALGMKKVKDVTREHVMRLHRTMGDTPRQANQTLAVLSKMFGLAELWGLRPDHSNPCRLVKRYAEQKRERFLSELELARLGAVLTEATRTATEHTSILAGIRVLLLTGCRLSEVLSLRWDYVDSDGACLRLPRSKTGAKVVPLGTAALQVLSELPRDGDFVLPSVKSNNAPLSVSTMERAWGRIKAKAGLSDVRLHDFRRTAGTYAGQAGANAFLVRDLLGHKTLAMTARYVQRDADPLRALANRVSGRIAEAMAGNTGEVVELSEHRN